MFAEVLIGIDGHAGGRDAIALASKLADRGAKLMLANVHAGSPRVQPWGYEREYDCEAALDEESARLLEAERELAELDAPCIPVSSPSVGAGLHGLAKYESADLIVVGSTRHSPLGRMFMGDHARSALSRAPCAVAIAPTGYAECPRELNTIGIGYDSSPESDLALATARSLAARRGSKIRAISVVPAESVDRESLRWEHCDDIDGDATYGEPGEVLERFSDEVDLLIVGSRGDGPVARLINGSTSDYLARHARCPLLVIRPRLAMTQNPAERLARVAKPQVAPR